MPKFIKLDGELENVELVCRKTDGTKYDFNRFSLPLKFIEKIYKYEITLNEAIEKQAELIELINKVNNYGPRIFKFFDARDDIIDLFEKETFPYKANVLKKRSRIKKRIKKGKKQKSFSNILRMN